MARLQRFCDLLRGFEQRLTPVMRQHQSPATRRLWIIPASDRIVDPATANHEAEIFVACSRRPHLCGGDLDATAADWTGAVRSFGSWRRAEIAGSDNLKSGVNKAR